MGKQKFFLDHIGKISTNGVFASPEDLRARLEAGVHIRDIGKPNVNVRATFTYDGIGSDNFESLGFSFRVNIPFN